MLETAIDHAQAAGDVDRVARLVLKIANPVWASGRVRHRAAVDGVVRGQRVWSSATRRIAVHGALIFALLGRPGDDRAVGGRRPSGPIRDRRRSPMGTRWRPRSPTCARCCAATGVVEMRRDAQIALARARPGQSVPSDHAPRRGRVVPARGRPGQADAIFARAVGRGDGAGSCRSSPSSSPNAASSRSSRMTGRAETFADEAMTHMKDRSSSTTTGRVPSSTRGGAVGVARGDDRAQGRQLVARAARLRPLLNYALPVVSVQALLEMARAYIALADAGGARAVLRQANDIFQQRPDLGVLPDAGRRAADRSSTR